jgi:serine/threonine protein kinase
MNDSPSSDPAALSLDTRRRIADVCERFDRACGDGRHPRIEDFLAAAGSAAERRELLRALLEVEFYHLRDAGQTVRLDDYARRFPGHAESIRAAAQEVTPVSMADPFPGEFRLLRSLGSGAFGIVWLAEDVHLGREVALKMVRPPGDPAEAGSRLELLRAEARLLAAVRHRNVVQVYAWRESPAGEHCLVLQYIPGGSFADRVGPAGSLPWAAAGRYVADVAEGLVEVHDRGIVHRDVKPANILWDPERDEALLTDFGVSARFGDAGSAAGTPLYMPPEAFAGVVSPAQDVYGLAASLFRLVTGQAPFAGPDASTLVAQARRGLPDPDPRCREMPEPLERLVRAGLAAERSRRPSLKEFAASLRGTLNQLLADRLLPSDGPARPQEARVRLIVSRRTGAHTFVPVAASHPTGGRLVRDMRVVPREPERVELHTGDVLRIEAEADRPGFLTVFNVGPKGNLNRLVPDEASRGPAAVEANRPLPVLDVELTPPAGRERLVALWSRTPLPLSPEELRQVADRGELPLPEPYRATRDMKRLQETVQQLAPDDWCATVLQLDHIESGDQ